MSLKQHLDYMSLALQLAERGRFTVTPNPMVGCVIVKDGLIIGEGYHQQAGLPHAEINALKSAGQSAVGATAYITLEPCCYHGKTPACTKALIKAGIKKVYIASVDPNPLVNGKGIAALQSAGIEVKVGLCENEAKVMNEIFFHYMRHRRPFVIAKWAMSLDGKTITHRADTRDLSCHESCRHAHQVRRYVDAVLVGANTARLDNPHLTVRFGEEAIIRHPTRIILSSRGGLPLDLNLFEKKSQIQTIVATTDAVDKKWCCAIAAKNIEILILPKNENHQVHLPTLLDVLGKKQITSILVEGGITVHENFFSEHLVNKIQFYLCPVIIGSLAKKHPIKQVNVRKLGRDFYFSATFKEHTHV